jgi:hypothetical protein
LIKGQELDEDEIRNSILKRTRVVRKKEPVYNLETPHVQLYEHANEGRSEADEADALIVTSADEAVEMNSPPILPQHPIYINSADGDGSLSTNYSHLPGSTTFTIIEVPVSDEGTQQQPPPPHQQESTYIIPPFLSM